MFSSSRSSKRWSGFAATISIGMCLQVAAHAAVAPPPLPPGSSMVEVESGLSKQERKRHVRAHSHKFRHKKDHTRDDTVHGEPEPLTQAIGNGRGNQTRDEQENGKGNKK